VAAQKGREPVNDTTGTAAAALAVVGMAGQGRFAEIQDRFAPPLRAMVPPQALQAAWDAELARSGPLIQVGTPVAEPAGPGAFLVKVPVRFERRELTVAVGLAGEEPWVTGLQLLPAEAARPTDPWRPPGYANPESFTEQEVTLGAGPLAVPGTMTLPRGDRPAAGVVLLAGSGPNDADETIGRNKPFKDLAWGLASAGVAVLRFEKVTHAHPGQVRANPDFTLTDEYVPHAVAAIGALRDHPAVDARRVCLAGHSLGGTVAPRVAAAEPSVAGLVIMAGGAQPLHWSGVRQLRYLASLDDPAARAPQAAAEVMTRQARLIDGPELTAQTPATELPFGVPAPYWLDLRGYDPATAAAALGRPMLIVQGGRDYQVTVADDLSRWRAALGGRPGVTIRVFAADNHLFFPGSGPSSPAEYEPAQHVDPEVVTAIAGWLAAVPPLGQPAPGRDGRPDPGEAPPRR
jgi:dienelactone hydrolase